LDDGALDPFAAAVNQPHFPKTSVVRRSHVFLDHRRDVPRLEGVKVQGILDRNAMDVS
jgi:hypothetical protein